MGVCNCSMFCCTLLYVHFSIAIILMGKRELIALLNLSSWCLVMDERLFLTVPLGCLQFVIVVFPDHIHLLFYCFFISLKFRTCKLLLQIVYAKIQEKKHTKLDLVQQTQNVKTPSSIDIECSTVMRRF